MTTWRRSRRRFWKRCVVDFSPSLSIQHLRVFLLLIASTQANTELEFQLQEQKSIAKMHRREIERLNTLLDERNAEADNANRVAQQAEGIQKEVIQEDG